MDFHNGHFNSPKLVYCLLIIFLGVLTAPGLADWGRKSPIRNFRGEGKATPLVIIYTPAYNIPLIFTSTMDEYVRKVTRRLEVCCATDSSWT